MFDSNAILLLIFIRSVIVYTIRYKLVIILGPMNRPNQKTTFPKVSLPLINFVLLKAASGN